MSDLAKWKVHGPVYSLRTDFAEWDSAKQEWRPLRHFNSATFHPDGKLDESRHYNPDGSIARHKCLYDGAGRLIERQFWVDDAVSNQTLYSYDNAGRHVRTVCLSRDGIRQDTEASTYDSSGRKTTVRFLAAHESKAAVTYGIEGTDHSYGAPGAVTMTMAYDGRDLPAELLFHNAQKALVRRIIFVRDNAGRLLREEAQFGETAPFPGLEEQAERSGPEGRAQVKAIVARLFGPVRAFSTITYAYDERGLLIERSTRTGSLGEDRISLRYDEHDNPIEQTTVHESREFHPDDHGDLHITSERSHTQHSRFEYQYDEKGNWIERVVLVRTEPNPNLERSNIEHREISYHA